MAAIVTLNFYSAQVTTNNLGGANKASNASCESCAANEIRYGSIGTLAEPSTGIMTTLDLVVTNTSVYDWFKPTVNGKVLLSDFGTINVPNQPGDSVSLKFTFVRGGTNEATTSTKTPMAPRSAYRPTPASTNSRLSPRKPSMDLPSRTVRPISKA